MTDKIRLHHLDLQFKDDVAREPGCQHLLRCFACGVCTASCPVSAIEPGFSPSQIIRQIFYGMREALLSSQALWYCARCANCSFKCPQDVRFLDIIQGLQQMALREGAISAARLAQLERGERLLQQLRRRLIARILEAPEDMEIKTALAGLLKDLDEV